MNSQGPGAARKPHTLADHLHGALADHVHDEGSDHDHDHDHDVMDGLLTPGSDEHVVLTSIGIDIGSSGTQIAFTRLTLERAHDPAESEHDAMPALGRRELIYQSPVTLTPFDAADLIDEKALGIVLDEAFTASAIHPDNVDCGVVILTGLARERANAETIARRLAADCGDIVSASAGHHMEAQLAAHGSGALALSELTGRRFLNVDIGGGTTKLAICDGGRVSATAALQIGGRLVAWDSEGVITRLAPAGQAHATRAGLDLQIGGRVTAVDTQRLGKHMADALVSALVEHPLPDEIRELYVTDPLPDLGAIDGIMVSGGVGEFVYGRETREFGDTGLALGQSLTAHIDAGRLPWPLMSAVECIRATVLGASACSVQLSGRTGWISSPARLLPRRNLQVLHPRLDLGDDIDPGRIADAIRAHLRAFDAGTGDEDIALAIGWLGLPDYPRLKGLAQGIADGLGDRFGAGRPAYIIIDGDIARSLGAMLTDELQISSDLLVLDGIRLADFDYIDLGRIRMPSQTVPVTIKTLVFRQEGVQKRRTR